MAPRKAARATKKAKKPASRAKAAAPSARKSSAKSKGAAKKGAVKVKKAGARKAAAKKAVAKKKVAAPKKAAARKAAKPVRAAKPAPRRSATKTGATKRAAKSAAVRPAVRSLAKPAAKKTVVRAKATPGTERKAPSLDRARRIIQDDDEIITSPPSTLDMDRTASSARSGRQALAHRLHDHNETGPGMTGGDVDADWESAYSVGDEAPGGDNPTPDQDIVDDIGRALGNEYQDNEPLKGADKIIERDKHRWELDPGSKEDFDDRD
jgi:hypothetical protein